MTSFETIYEFFTYSDEMNRRLLKAAGSLSAERLDQKFDLGVGSLRKVLAHILIGEQVWLERCRGNVEAKWPYETDQTPSQMLEELEQISDGRTQFLSSLDDAALIANLQYRDSKGGLYVATLHDMLMQTITHSTHHRAQAVHLLRHVGGEFVEMDFMYWRRRTPSN